MQPVWNLIQERPVLEDWRFNPPKNSQQLQTWLGFAGYYRSFVKNFAKIAKPLYHLIGGRPPRGPKTPPFLWTEHCQEAFECLISCLTSPHYLATLTSSYPSQRMSMLVVQTGCHSLSNAEINVSIKRRNGPVFSYGSRTLSPAERNYSAYRREFLTLKWAVAEKFRDSVWLQIPCDNRQEPFNILGNLC